MCDRSELVARVCFTIMCDRSELVARVCFTIVCGRSELVARVSREALAAPVQVTLQSPVYSIVKMNLFCCDMHDGFFSLLLYNLSNWASGCGCLEYADSK
jgi:hypothetical protein